MRVSTKGRYGLRILLDIAQHQQEGPVALRDISRRQAISQKYLWQVINPLKVAGLLRATRGAHGGYRLAKSPARISLRDVVDILEGPLSVVACVQTPGSCDRSDTCIARGAWTAVETRLNDAMEEITLKTLLDKDAEQALLHTPSFDI